MKLPNKRYRVTYTSAESFIKRTILVRASSEDEARERAAKSLTQVGDFRIEKVEEVG